MTLIGNNSGHWEGCFINFIGFVNACDYHWENTLRLFFKEIKIHKNFHVQGNFICQPELSVVTYSRRFHTE